MKRMTFALLGLCIVVPAHSQSLNPSPYEWRDQGIEIADKDVVQGTFRVALLTGQDVPKVSFQGPAEMIADAEASVENGTLIIAFKDGKPWSSHPGSRMSAVVYLPSVSSVKTIGPAQINIPWNKAESFSAAIDGAGRIEVERLEAQNVNAAIGGSGSIRLEGTANEASYAIGGAGSIEGKRLRVADAKIAIGGAGSVYADVSNTADVAVGGGGRVEIVGGARCNVQPVASPRVECR